ncbi:MAG TPA: tRNA glutamyl-Q(34) synthetase GluQRS [Steroidobacteraceae bacterium]|nr:tRNA glutamyl-Q(34) synthetase GluQRS [Steroidobacteraceae bacterium]
MSNRRRYVGRFAPSPTGPLHFGSLIAAVGSYLQARVAKGRWIVRMEDIDQSRIVPGADEQIIRTLAAFGFEWDDEIIYQSNNLYRYSEVISKLEQDGKIYPCSCSRALIASSDEQRYPGTCRNGVTRPNEPVALRFRVESGSVEFVDALQGLYAEDVTTTSGDFIVKRRDGHIAYHLAVVVDDADQGITEVVRGADLLSSTPRQILLQRALRMPTPMYCHLPLAIDGEGKKLSKSAQSVPIDPAQASEVLWRALTFLRQAPPSELRSAGLVEIWGWAKQHWNLQSLRQVKSDSAPSP